MYVLAALNRLSMRPASERLLPPAHQPSARTKKPDQPTSWSKSTSSATRVELATVQERRAPPMALPSIAVAVNPLSVIPRLSSGRRAPAQSPSPEGPLIQSRKESPVLGTARAAWRRSAVRFLTT